MPPGASILMRGLGMRDTERHIKNKHRGRKDLDNYNRPKPLLLNGDGGIYPMPGGVRGNRSFKFPPYMADEDMALVGTNYLDAPQGALGGLKGGYVWRLFEYERSQWPRQGFISPYRGHRGRATRDELEFELWLQWHPNRGTLEEKMDGDYGRGYVRPPNCIHNDLRKFSRLIGELGHSGFGLNQEPYRPRRGRTGHKRPPHRQRGFIDIRDPKYRPPYPDYGTNGIHRGTHRPPFETFPGRRGRHSRRYRPPRIFPDARNAFRSPHPMFGDPGHGMRRGSLGRPVEDYYPSTGGRTHPRIYAGFDPRSQGRDLFVPRIPRPRHPHHHLPDEDEFDFEDEDSGSQRSFIRRPPPFHSGPLRPDRYETYMDDEDEDEFFGGRGGYLGRGRDSFGIGGERGMFGYGNRGYGRGEVDYGFSGDDDDVYDER